MRAQSSVSDTDGGFFRSRERIERTTRATCSASAASISGIRALMIRVSRSMSG